MPWPTLVLDTAAGTAPVTLTEAKDYMRVDETDDDTLITDLIISATQYVETRTNRQLVTATWDQIYDTFPQFIRLRKPPLQSVTSIIFLDTAGTSQTLATNQFQVITSREPGMIFEEPSASWPDTESERRDAVTVKFIAGYGAASVVPDGLKTAIKMLVNTWYENREDIVVGSIVAEMKGNATIDRMLRPYTIDELR